MRNGCKGDGEWKELQDRKRGMEDASMVETGEYRR